MYSNANNWRLICVQLIFSMCLHVWIRSVHRFSIVTVTSADTSFNITLFSQDECEDVCFYVSTFNGTLSWRRRRKWVWDDWYFLCFLGFVLCLLCCLLCTSPADIPPPHPPCNSFVSSASSPVSLQPTSSFRALLFLHITPLTCVSPPRLTCASSPRQFSLHLSPVFSSVFVDSSRC